MNGGPALVASAGADRRRAMRKSRWRAPLDWLRSATGLVLPIDYRQYREGGLDRAQPLEGTP